MSYTEFEKYSMLWLKVHILITDSFMTESVPCTKHCLIVNKRGKSAMNLLFING